MFRRRWGSPRGTRRECSCWRRIASFSAARAAGREVPSHLQGRRPAHTHLGRAPKLLAPGGLFPPGHPRFCSLLPPPKGCGAQLCPQSRGVTWSRAPAPRPGMAAGAERPPAPQPQPPPPRPARLAVASGYPSFPGVPRPLAPDGGRPSQIRLGGSAAATPMSYPAAASSW